MCGISGFIATSARSAGTLFQMTDLIRHRGPDDAGFVLFPTDKSPPLVLGTPQSVERHETVSFEYSPTGVCTTASDSRVGVALGHRRLAIVDLSAAGHQPMCSPGGRYWIVYNGEIYNYQELRTELEALGHAFRSHSDTEVLLAAYAQWGQSCQDRLNGMWAFALHDLETGTTFLSRDRFGIKPLYYWVAPCGTLCFGSEIKQFTAFPGWSARLNAERAYDFLAWALTDHTDETLFRGVYQLRPGYCAQVPAGGAAPDATGRIVSTRWYTLAPKDFNGSFEEASREFRERLFESVRLQLHADVRVGSCLSGGLDSSSIVCIISQLLAEEGNGELQATFSAVSEIARFDESRWIRKVVDTLSVDDHYVTPPVGRLFDEIPTIAWHQDEPFGSTSIYAQWNVFRLAAESGVKVMLDGQGADEQLAGYHGFLAPHLSALLRSGRLGELWTDIRATKRRLGYSELRALMYIANVILPTGLKQVLRARSNRNHARPSWLDFSRLAVQATDPLQSLGNYGKTVRSMSIAQLTATNLQMLLRWEDRDSMAHSIESRVPFLDHRLVEFVLGLPDEFKLHRGITKRVQRAAMEGVLPEEVRDRTDKMGFVTPEESWMLDTMADEFERRIGVAVERSQGIVTAEAIALFRKMRRREVPFSFVPWRLISFGEWMHRFEVSIA